MPTILQLRRGTTTEHASFTGAVGEITVNTTKDTLVVHDGSTQGGFEIALADLSNTSAITLSNLSAGTGITYNSGTGEIGADTTTMATKTYVDTQVQSKDALSELSGTTDDVTEGSTNVYYTDARVKSLLTTLDGSIVPSADVTYDLGSSTKQWKDIYVGPGSLYVNGQQVVSDNSGTITISADSNQNVAVQTSGSGDIELDPTGTGTVQIKGTLQIEDGQNITNSAGNDITFANNIKVDQITTKSTDTNLVLSGNGTGNVTVNDDINITGNLTVGGTTTTVNSETINLADNTIVLNSNFTSGSPTEDAGLSISRGGSSAVTFLWDETNDKWTIGSETFVAGTVEANLTGNVTGTVSSLSNHDTDDVAEGSSNLYYTDARAQAAISVGGDLSKSGGTISFSETYSSATELLNALKTVDGAGSGLDSDLLDGQSSSYYRINIYNSAGTLLN